MAEVEKISTNKCFFVPVCRAWRAIKRQWAARNALCDEKKLYFCGKKNNNRNKMIILITMNTKVIMLLLLVAVVLVAAGCARFFGRGHSREVVAHDAYADVNVSEFQTLIADPDMQLLDVRTREEFDEGHIAGAVLVDVGDADFVDKAAAVLDKERPVAVYCRSGRRSARVARLLTDQGFKVTNLNGGVLAWEDAGKALIK